MKLLLIFLLMFTVIWESVAEYKNSADQLMIKETVRKIAVADIGLNNVS